MRIIDKPKNRDVAGYILLSGIKSLSENPGGSKTTIYRITKI